MRHALPARSRPAIVSRASCIAERGLVVGAQRAKARAAARNDSFRANSKVRDSG